MREHQVNGLLEPARGLEPLTFRLQGGRSAVLSYAGVDPRGPVHMVEVSTVGHLRLSRYSGCEQDVIASCLGGPIGSAGRWTSTLSVLSQAGWGLRGDTVDGRWDLDVAHATSRLRGPRAYGIVGTRHCGSLTNLLLTYLCTASDRRVHRSSCCRC